MQNTSLKIKASRKHYPSPREFAKLLHAKMIRGASLEDVLGTHHDRPLYQHPHTFEWFVQIKE